MASKFGQFSGDERSHADILQTDRVYHTARCFADTRRRGSLHGLDRKTLYNDGSQLTEIYDRCEFDSIAKRTASCNDGVFKMEGTDADAKVNSRGPWGTACRLRRIHDQ